MGPERFGWDALTFSFIGTVVTNLISLWGIREQNRRVWKTQSGRSVSVTMMAYSAAFLTAAAVYGVSEYGFDIPENALIVNLIRVPVFIAVLAGLWKFKGFTARETLLCILFVLMVATTAILPRKDWIFFALCVGTWFSLLPQAVEIWKHGRGVADVRFLWVTVFSAFIWTVYGIALGDWVLIVTNPVFLVIIVATLALWYVRREPLLGR